MPATGPWPACWYNLSEQTPPFLLQAAFVWKGQRSPLGASAWYSASPLRRRSCGESDSRLSPYHSSIEYLLRTFGFFVFGTSSDYQHPRSVVETSSHIQ